MASPVTYERLGVDVDGVRLNLALYRRTGISTPILFLHGWGSSKEDYVDIHLNPDFQGRPFLAYDAPGCGDSHCDDLSKVDIPFLVRTAEEILHHFQISACHVVGHSMGGLTALELAHANPKTIRSFVDIKGNLAPEDCFISRQIFDRKSEDMDVFLEEFITGCRQSSYYSAPLYAASIRQRVRLGAIKGIFESMVQLSDHEDLISKFLSLPCPKIFIFGEQHAKLSYLPKLREAGIGLREIPHAGHFPMYSNPVAMWSTIRDFLERAESP